MAALYSTPLASFLREDPSKLLGILTEGLAKEEFDTTKLTAFSWLDEIADLQNALHEVVAAHPASGSWHLFLEYIIPIIRQRVDCVLIAEDLIYVIEYKAGETTSARSALKQAQEYALNLTDFHEESRGRIIVPIALGTFKNSMPLDVQSLPQRGSACAANHLPKSIAAAQQAWAGRQNQIDPAKWNASRYFPVPTIIEAASAVYHNHGVKDLAQSRSGQENLQATQEAILDAVRDAMARSVKKLIVVTGVPGAGKTLAGLEAVQRMQRLLDLNSQQASFLSGNGPLVTVLQEALKRSVARRKKGVSRSIQSRVREMHRFVRDSYGDNRPPSDRLIVFDEAQRAWTAAKNKKKFGRDVSEPEMVLEIMGRHEGWAAVVALVGGGQEIHGGEAGLAAWGDALANNANWEVVTSPEALHGGPAVAGSRLFRGSSPAGLLVKDDPALHLAISKRSFETEVTAMWVNALLNGQHAECSRLATKGLPIYMARDLHAIRRWLRDRQGGNRRTGLVASSGAARLRAEGVEPPTFSFLGGIDYSKWFLEPDGDHRSSNQLEVALSEFELQGLEIDLVGLLWGGDLVFPDDAVVARKFTATRWIQVDGTGDPQASADDPRTRVLNKYRVLLTRFRKAMVIFVPRGSPDDPTRKPDDFDSVYEYLTKCGVQPLAD